MDVSSGIGQNPTCANGTASLNEMHAGGRLSPSGHERMKVQSPVGKPRSTMRRSVTRNVPLKEELFARTVAGIGACPIVNSKMPGWGMVTTRSSASPGVPRPC